MNLDRSRVMSGILYEQTRHSSNIAKEGRGRMVNVFMGRVSRKLYFPSLKSERIDRERRLLDNSPPRIRSVAFGRSRFKCVEE